MKILNLYAGIGGNRKLWEDAEITAVELNEEIANIYKEYFPNDNVVIGDAHEYLLKHYLEFDFIWSSPPCQSHSGNNKFLNPQGIYRYPDMKLWQEIIYLKSFCKCKYVVENVVPYYDVFIEPSIELNRHLFWTNFRINKIEIEDSSKKVNNLTSADIHFGYNLKDISIKDKRTVLRNCVNPEIGLHILDCAREFFNRKPQIQKSLF